MFKLKNWVSPQAMAAMGLFETAFVADDVLRKGKPLNEAVADNWFTSMITNLDAETQRAKNILASDKYQLSPPAKEYAQSLVDIENYENLERKKNLPLMVAGVEGDPKVKEKIESEMSALREKIMNTSTSGALDYQNISDEKQATWKAKAKDAPFLGYDSYTSGQREKRNVPGEFIIDPNFPLPLQKEITVPSYVSENYKTSNITEQDVINMYKDEGWISPTEYKSGYKLSPGELTWWRMQDPGRGTYGTQEKFMGGGIAAIRKPHAIPPKRQGLRSIMINVNDD